MRIKILFFATLRDYVGEKSVEMDVPVGTSVVALRKILVERYPKMASAEKTIMTSINREYASDGQVLPDNAEIALFPPVSGG